MRRYNCYTDRTLRHWLGCVEATNYLEADKLAKERFGGYPYLMMCM